MPYIWKYNRRVINRDCRFYLQKFFCQKYYAVVQQIFQMCFQLFLFFILLKNSRTISSTIVSDSFVSLLWFSPERFWIISLTNHIRSSMTVTLPKVNISFDCDLPADVFDFISKFCIYKPIVFFTDLRFQQLLLNT